MRDKQAANRRERAIWRAAPASGLAVPRSWGYRSSMTEKQVTGPRRGQGGDRSERLSEALRANLRRRKAQARGRSAAQKEGAASEGSNEAKGTRD